MYQSTLDAMEGAYRLSRLKCPMNWPGSASASTSYEVKWTFIVSALEGGITLGFSAIN